MHKDFPNSGSHCRGGGRGPDTTHALRFLWRREASHAWAARQNSLKPQHREDFGSLDSWESVVDWRHFKPWLHWLAR